jgi:hypothetical protein
MNDIFPAGRARALGGLRGLASRSAWGLRTSGRYTLELPFRDDRELVLEIMKHGGGVEVI